MGDTSFQATLFFSRPLARKKRKGRLRSIDLMEKLKCKCVPIERSTRKERMKAEVDGTGLRLEVSGEIRR